MNAGHKRYQDSLNKAAAGEKDQVKVRSKVKAPPSPAKRPMQTKPQSPSKVRRKSVLPSIFMGALCLVGVAGLSWALINLDDVDRFFSRLDISMFTSAAAEGNEEKKDQAKDETVGKKDAGEAKREPSSVPKKESLTQEEINYFNKLSERKRELDEREQSLKKLEDELHKQKEEIGVGLAELQKMRQQISTMLKDRVEIDGQRVDMLVQFYSTMKPQNAAQVFENINDDLAIEILTKMKKKNAADILNLLKADKAKFLSERMAGYKRK